MIAVPVPQSAATISQRHQNASTREQGAHNERRKVGEVVTTFDLENWYSIAIIAPPRTAPLRHERRGDARGAIPDSGGA
jgi:hypothetical protein